MCNNNQTARAKIHFAKKVLPIGGRSSVISGIDGDPFYESLTPNHFEGMTAGGYGIFDLICAKYLRPDYVMIDVGANIGITALVAGAYIPEGKIVAIDASPRNCEALEVNLRSNGFDNAIVVPFAVGSKPGELQFNEAGAHGHILTQSVALGRAGITVPVKTIDQIVAEHQLPKVDFIKIDIEGFERDAIIGAEQTIATWDPLFYVEFNSWCQIAVHDESPLRFYDFLLERFPHVYRIEEDHLVALKKGEGLIFLHQNIIFKGCVEDVVATTNADRLIEAPNYLAKVVERLKAEKELLRLERDASLQERGRLLAEPQNLQAECDRLQAECARLATKLNRMKHSAYWRLGGPFRKMAKKLK